LGFSVLILPMGQPPTPHLSNHCLMMMVVVKRRGPRWSWRRQPRGWRRVVLRRPGEKLPPPPPPPLTSTTADVHHVFLNKEKFESFQREADPMLKRLYPDPDMQKRFNMYLFE
jgi:hypothetical protein